MDYFQMLAKCKSLEESEDPCEKKKQKKTEDERNEKRIR